MEKPFIKSIKGIVEVVSLDGIGADVLLCITLRKSHPFYQERVEEYLDEYYLTASERKEVMKELPNKAFVIVTYDTEIGEHFEVQFDQNCESIFAGLELPWEHTEKIRKFLGEKELFEQYVVRKWEKKGYMVEKYQ